MNLIDIPTVDTATLAALDKGVLQFQIHLAGDNDREHVDVLLGLAQIPLGAVVLDAGCGVGETMRLMQDARPDIHPILLNISAFQLSLCPPHMQHIHGDFHRTPLADASADVVLHMHSLSQTDAPTQALSEANRVLPIGGTLFIVDLFADATAKRDLWRTMGANLHDTDSMARLLSATGFEVGLVKTLTPVVDQLAILQPDVANEWGRGVRSVAVHATKIANLGGVK